MKKVKISILGIILVIIHSIALSYFDHFHAGLALGIYGSLIDLLACVPIMILTLPLVFFPDLVNQEYMSKVAVILFYFFGGLQWYYIGWLISKLISKLKNWFNK